MELNYYKVDMIWGKCAEYIHTQVGGIQTTRVLIMLIKQTFRNFVNTHSQIA